MTLLILLFGRAVCGIFRPWMEAVHPEVGAWSLNYFPGGSVVKNPPARAGDMGTISGLGSSPGGGNGYSVLYFCLGNSTDRGAWQVTVHGVAKSEGTQ